MSIIVLVLIIVALVAICLVGWFISTNNKFIRLSNYVDNQYSQIDVQLKRRYSLIPNLVETVKGYAAHEKDTLEAVIAARNYASSQTGIEEVEANRNLSSALSRLFAISESYPELKANANFMNLQNELIDTEEKIAKARQFYNDTVTKYNIAIQSFPGSIVASGRFQVKPLIQAGATESGEIKVQF